SGVLGHGLKRIFRRDLAKSDHAGVLVNQLTQTLEEIKVLRPGVVVLVSLVGVRVVGGEPPAFAFRFWLGRIVTQLRIMEAKVDRVQAKAVHASLEQKLDLAQNCVLYIWVVKVKVRLTF